MRRPPKPVTRERLENAALAYLDRFASSSGHLKRLLMRRVRRSAEVDGGDTRQGEELVEELVARYLRAGLLDDRAYATQQAEGLRRRGGSRHAIRGKLAQKGITGALIDATLRALDRAPGESELAAACALVRRRRLGPCRAAPGRALHARKDLAVLARAGFPLALARRVLAAPDAEALEALAGGEDD